ncbi:MAG: methyltransferase domain-containing protein [Thermoplasmata archaeon]
MKSRALVVPRADGEDARLELMHLGALRTDLRIVRDGERIVLPVVEGAELPSGLGTPSEREFESFTTPHAREYRDLVRLPPNERELLPRSFDVVGDVVLIRIPPELEKWGPDIGEALLRFVPGARIVGADHGVHGTQRRRRLVQLAGAGDFRTIHRENGIAFDIDLELAYFSPRLAREHARVAEDVEAGEEVDDLCCGVGPFAVTIARDGRARRVTAVDSNPAAIALLRSTLARCAYADRVEPVEADVAAFLSSASPVDRVILNLPHEGIKYLPSVGTLVRPGGVVHYYEVTTREGADVRAEDLVNRIGGSAHWSRIDQHVVHPYSPQDDLVAFQFVRADRAEDA